MKIHKAIRYLLFFVSYTSGTYASLHTSSWHPTISSRSLDQQFLDFNDSSLDLQAIEQENKKLSLSNDTWEAWDLNAMTQDATSNADYQLWNSSVSLDSLENNKNSSTTITQDAIKNVNIFDDNVENFEEIFKAYVIKNVGDNYPFDSEKLILHPANRNNEKKLQVLMTDDEFNYAVQANIEILNLLKNKVLFTKEMFKFYFEMLLFQLFVPDFLDTVHDLEYRSDFIVRISKKNKNFEMFLAPQELLRKFIAYYNDHQYEQEELAQLFYPLLKKINHIAMQKSLQYDAKSNAVLYLKEYYHNYLFHDLLSAMRVFCNQAVDNHVIEDRFW